MTTLAPIASVLRDKTITMAHGAGGRAMRELVEKLIVPTFAQTAGDAQAPLEDQARLPLQALAAHGDRLAFTTDSYVVSPLFFPGGDIGKLAACGTINDLAMGGARPLYLSCGLVIEEGFPVMDLQRILHSLAQVAAEAGVRVVTGDTKVVNRGAADKLFINTSGVGVIPAGVNISAAHAQVGDAVLVNGTLGDHGVAILMARNELELHGTLESDCQALHTLVDTMLAACPEVHCVRDATRGGVASVLNEFAQASKVGIRVLERTLPIGPEVRGASEILGLEPLYMANEGKLVAIVPAEAAQRVLHAMRQHPAGRQAACIGTVCAEHAGSVVLETIFGGERMLDLLVGEQLPRIC